jgi:hypothetical protein
MIYVIFVVQVIRKEWKKTKRVRVMVFNATFNNISVILWLSVVLVEKKENIELKKYNFFEIDVTLTSMSYLMQIK